MGCCSSSLEQAPLYLSLSRGMCRQCGKTVEVRYVADEEERVYLERHCPDHGVSRALVAESLTWYLNALKAPVAACPPEVVRPQKATLGPWILCEMAIWQRLILGSIVRGQIGLRD